MMVQFDVKRVSKGSESFMVSYDFAKTPITQIADSIIIAGSKKGSSDMHFDPREDGLMVRFRIDGDLQDYTFVPKAYEKNLATRLKLLANMNITETRLPQDGAIKGQFGDTYLDMRVSCLPVSEGEKIVIRILDYTRSLQGIDSLGFNEINLKKIKRMMGVPNGIILTTGATGSGKSTTTYSILQGLNTPETNIITVEDPIEMNIQGINQVQVNAEIGMTFAAALRSILRQDPNVILIGEIRDSETAQIAVRASITGHLVVSTIHTNNSLATIERLLDMDVERYLLSTALTGIISQRLAKQLCPHCRIQREATQYEKKVFKRFMGKNVNAVWAANPEGCENCRKGYRGRIAIQEVLELDDALRSAINNEKLTKEELTKMVYTDKTITMLQDALGKALEGITSFEEVYRVIEIESEDAGHYDDEEAESETEQGNTLADIPTTVIKEEEPTPQQEQPTTFEEQQPVEIPKPQETVTETETLEQVTLEVPNFLSQTPSTEPPTEAKTEPPQASVDNLLSGLIPVIDETPVSHPVEIEEENEQEEELFLPQQANTTEQIVLPSISQEQPTEVQTEPTPVETNTNDTFIQLNTGEPETEPVTEPETEVTTEQTEVLTLEKLDTTVEEINEDDTKSVLSTDIEIKGMAGINAEPLLPQF